MTWPYPYRHPLEAPRVAYTTALGTCFQTLAETVLNSAIAEPYKGQVDLIFTSPPFR